MLLLIDNFSAYKAAVGLIRESNQLLKWTRIEWFPANTTSIFQPLDQGIIQNWKCYVKKQLLQFLMTEFDAGRDYTKTHHVLRAIEWSIQAWESVDSTLITRCWQRGFREVKEVKEGPVNSCWAESLELIQEIQGLASSLATSNQRIEPADIRSFIHSEDERIVDSEEDITDQIIAHYSLQDDQEVSVEEVAKVSVSEAIVALNTLKLYQEQRD